MHSSDVLLHNDRAYSILGSVSVFNIKITFFGLVGSNMLYVRNTNKVIFTAVLYESKVLKSNILKCRPMKPPTIPGNLIIREDSLTDFFHAKHPLEFLPMTLDF